MMTFSLLALTVSAISIAVGFKASKVNTNSMISVTANKPVRASHTTSVTAQGANASHDRDSDSSDLDWVQPHGRYYLGSETLELDLLHNGTNKDADDDN